MTRRKKLIRITTIPLSLDKLLEDQLRFMNQYYDVIAISSNVEELKRVGIKEGVEIFHVEMTRKITPIRDLVCLVKLIGFFIKCKPDIVHTHTPKAGILGMLAAKITNVPIRLHTVAGLPLLETGGIKREILVYVERLTYYCAKKVYPNSFGLKKIMEEEILPKKSNLKVIGNGSSNGINTHYFSEDSLDKEVLENLKRDLNITLKDFVFIFVGRIVKDKGINELVECFNTLNKNFENIKLLLVGPEEAEDPIEINTRRIISNNNNIIALGYANDVRPFFAISQALVFPSYREGFPNVVMQAGAMNLPCIVTNINGCNEIIMDSINGKLISSKNKMELIEAMKYFLLNRQEYEDMKNRSREIIVKNYERKVIIKAILDEYKKLEKEINVS